MYEHFRPSERVFVDREVHLDWMSEALQRCKEKSVVLHIRGIGGIGKSSLLEHWHQTVEKSIVLDCSRITDFFGRLDIIAKGAVRLGISLSRFDVLWSIRQRFVQGVEPAKEEGRGWAMDIIAPLPFIGSLTGIGTAIKAISQKISPKLTGKYGSLGSWLQSRLGKDYLEELLEILWKDPRNAEFLYLDALLEDLNNRKDSKSPILIVLDSFDYVDEDDLHWTYKGRRIAEGELWFVFLSSLSNSVGVVASRKALPKNMDATLSIEVAELCELDCDSCLELLAKRNLIDDALQQKIIEVSGGNPFILDTICDMFSMGGLSSEDVESFRADTLEEVRNKTWKKLFSQVKDLEPVIERASLLPHFDRYLLEVVYPKLKTFQWEQLVRFSFVRERGDGTWELHSLAKDLVLAELGRQLGPLTSEVATQLEKESEEEDNPSLLGLAFSVEALYSEEKAIPKAKEVISYLNRRESSKEALGILNSLIFRTTMGKAMHLGLLGWALHNEDRYAEAEAALKEAISAFEDLSKNDFSKYSENIAHFSAVLGLLLQDTDRLTEAEVSYARGLEIIRRLSAEDPDRCSEDDAAVLSLYGFFLGNILGRQEEGLQLAQESVEIYEQSNERRELPFALNILASLNRWAGNLDAAVMTYNRAISQQREAISEDPTNTRHKAVFAAMCGNLSDMLYENGKIDEAMNLRQESFDTRKELHAMNPDIYGGRFADALNQFGFFMWKIRQVSKAEPFFRKASKIYEELERNEPGGWTLHLSNNLFKMALVLVALERIPEAESVISRAIQLNKDHFRQIDKTAISLRSLAVDLARVVLQFYSRTYRISMTESVISELCEIYDKEECPSKLLEFFEGHGLSNIGASKLCMDQLSSTRNILEKALGLLSRHKEFMRVISRNYYAICLCNLAILHRREGQLEEAKDLYLQALSILEEIAHLIPTRFQRSLAVTLSNYSVLLMKMNLLDQAVAKLTRAIEIEREYCEIEPYLYESILAVSLNNKGILLSAMGRLSEAEESLNEAVRLRRRLAEQTQEIHQAGLAVSLHNLGILLKKAGRPGDAEAALKEAATNWEQLTVKVPDLFNPRLAKTLHHLRIILLGNDAKQSDMKAIQKRLSSLSFKFPDDAELWIEEEEPLFSW